MIVIVIYIPINLRLKCVSIVLLEDFISLWIAIRATKQRISMEIISSSSSCFLWKKCRFFISLIESIYEFVRPHSREWLCIPFNGHHSDHKPTFTFHMRYDNSHSFIWFKRIHCMCVSWCTQYFGFVVCQLNGASARQLYYHQLVQTRTYTHSSSRVKIDSSVLIHTHTRDRNETEMKTTKQKKYTKSHE